MSNNLSTTLQDYNSYYIHLNKVNAGSKAGNAAINFAAQKQQVAMQTMSQYKNWLNASINGENIETLAAALDMDENQFFNVLNQKLKEKMQTEINVNALAQLYQTVKDGNITQHLRNAVEFRNIKQLAAALKVIANALLILENGEGSLGAALLNALYTENGTLAFSSFKNLGNKLQTLLKEYQINNNYSVIKQQSLQKSIAQLNNLAFALQTNTFKTSKNQLSVEGLTTLLSNGIISTSIAQGLGFAASTKAGGTVHQFIVHAVGTNKVTVHSDIDKDIKITGKTDIQAQGVKVNLSTTDTGKNVDINLNIGISSKFYTGQNFKNLTKNEITSMSVGSGVGGSVKQALDSIFTDSSSRYLAYNYIVHDIKTKQLNDLIVKRQIIRLFATAGNTQDFAQLMLINGQIISIWDLIQYALNNDVGLSNSMDGSKSKGIVLSIPDRPLIHDQNTQISSEYSPLISAWIRSHKVNAAISSARIYAELHLRNLAQSYHS